MAPLEQSEKDHLIARILQQLSKSPYACSSLTQLTNGTTNFVFRGTLSQPLRFRDGIGKRTDTATTDTVIIKHSADFCAVNKDLPINVSRCVITSFDLDC
jgi:hypothetical protein